MASKRMENIKKQFMILKTYLIYLIKYRWYVFVECVKFGIPFRGLTHDLSRFLPHEFFPSARYYSGDRSDQTIDAFNIAWLKHQRTNRHHWQWWLLRNDEGNYIPLEMPKNLCYEMIADWIGAGRATRGIKQSYKDIYTWYKNNKHRIILNPYTEIAVRHILRNLAKVREEDEIVTERELTP